MPEHIYENGMPPQEVIPLCTCYHARTRHEDTALAPECLDCACTSYTPAVALTTAGGWCAPLDSLITLPHISAPLGGLTYRMPTPAEQAAADAMRARNTRAAEALARTRAEAIDAACVTALTEGWDVHVYDPPEPYQSISRWTTHDLTTLAHIGIAFTPAEHPIPTIHHHPTDPYDNWDDD